MAIVIREVVIRTRLESTKARLEAPDTSAFTKAMEEEKKVALEATRAREESSRAAKESAKAAKEGIRATDAWAAGLRRVNEEWRRGGSGRDSWGEGLQRIKVHADAANRAANEQVRSQQEVRGAIVQTTRTHDEFGYRSLQSFSRAGRGAIELSRGLALMGLAGEENSRKVVDGLIKIEAAVSIARGAAELAKFASKFGVPGKVIAATAATVAVGATAWNSYASAQRDAARAADEVRKAVQETERSMAENWTRQNQRDATRRNDRLRGIELESDFAITPEDREGALGRQREELSKQQKELAADRRRRVRGFNPENFNGNAGDATSALLQFGTQSQLNNARELAEQRRDNFERQLAIQKEQQQILRERQAARGGFEASFLASGVFASTAGSMLGMGGSNVIPSPLTGAFSQSVNQSKAESEQLIAAQREANKAIIAGFKELTTEINALRGAHPN